MPSDLLRDVDSLVGKRERSAFIAAAVRREVDRVRLLEAIDFAAGSWSDERHPELAQGAAEWVRSQRDADEKIDQDRRAGIPA